MTPRNTRARRRVASDMRTRPTKRAAKRRRTTTTRRRMKRATRVVVPMIAWQQPDHVYVEHKAHVRALKHVAKYARGCTHSVQLHAESCPFSIVVWPRQADQDLDEVALDAYRQACTCVPLVMYTGARA